MLFYEIKVVYQRQTGEDNPKKANETYLVEGINCTDVEKRAMDEIQPYIFGDSEVRSCKKAQYFDLFPHDGGEFWYKGRVEIITVDGAKETHRNVTVLVQADSLDEAVHSLQKHLGTYDCEILSVAKSPIVDVLRGV